MITRTLTTALATAMLVVAAPLAAQAAAKPADLFTQKSCVGCHSLKAKDPKKMGPNFAAVATKYPNNAATIAKLTKKIREGGAGAWGAIPMPPMKAQVTEADAKALAQYALSFKGK